MCEAKDSCDQPDRYWVQSTKIAANALCCGRHLPKAIEIVRYATDMAYPNVPGPLVTVKRKVEIPAPDGGTRPHHIWR